MTTQTQAREAIYQRLVTNYSASVYTFDGEKFSPPVNAGFVRLAVRHAGGGQESLGDIGDREFERVGLIIVQCFTPINGGARPADLLAESVKSIFEGVTFSGVRCYDAISREIGDDEQGYYQMNVEIAFAYNERK